MFLDPEASQENLKRPEKAPKRHPKRHPKVVQKLVKKWLKSEPKNGQKKTANCLKKIAQTAPMVCVFCKNGLLKTLTEDALKIAHRIKNSKAKNGPKMIPKWFKIAQIA